MYICIDAGHGGADWGVTGAGAAEKWVTGEVAARAGELLYTAGCLVFFTRIGDRKVSLAERVRSVQETDPDLLLSIHCAYSAWPEQRGLQLGYARGDPRSQLWAETILRAAEARLNGRTIARGARPLAWRHQGAGAALLKSVRMRIPGCLFDLGYLSNPLDAWLLQERFFLDDLARSIAAAALTWQRRAFETVITPEAQRHGGTA